MGINQHSTEPDTNAQDTKKKIAVYTGKNVAHGEPLIRMRQSFNDAAVGTVTGNDVKSGIALDQDTLAFFLPGITTDHSPYYSELGDEGNDKIREYVENGGVFIGGCAGAYYACDDILYDPPWLDAIKSTQPGLNFFNGLAHGPLPNLAKETGSPDWFEDCTHTAIRYETKDGEEKQTNIVYGNGPMLIVDDKEEGKLNVIARFEDVDGQPIAIATKKIGKGLAIFLGALPYYGADLYENTDSAHPLNRFIDAIKPFEDGRKELWDTVISIIEDHHAALASQNSIKNTNEGLGKPKSP